MNHQELSAQEVSDASWLQYGIRAISERWQRCGRGFVPLVTSDMEVRCKLDILFLRPGNPTGLISGGDLDNRLKTLFDALRLPANLEEAGGKRQEGEDNPTFCLLEDDRLISEVHVVTDSLLLLPHETKRDPNDVFLVIKVEIEAPAHSGWKYTLN